jgi:hypothetical protein
MLGEIGAGPPQHLSEEAHLDTCQALGLLNKSPGNRSMQAIGIWNQHFVRTTLWAAGNLSRDAHAWQSDCRTVSTRTCIAAPHSMQFIFAMPSPL